MSDLHDSDTSMSDTESDASIEAIEAVPATAPPPVPGVAMTVACNKCMQDIWGENKMAITECCKFSVCQICRDMLAATGQSQCPNDGCAERPVTYLTVWYTESTDVPSKNRDRARDNMVKGDPRYQSTTAQVEDLRRKSTKQTEQIQHYTRMHSVLQDQVGGAADKLAEISRETDEVLGLVAETQRQTVEMCADNDRIRARIHALNAKTQAIEARLESGGAFTLPLDSRPGPSGGHQS